MDNTKENVMKLLMMILKDDFRECSEKWKECWDKRGSKVSTCPR